MFRAFKTKMITQKVLEPISENFQDHYKLKAEFKYLNYNLPLEQSTYMYIRLISFSGHSNPLPLSLEKMPEKMPMYHFWLTCALLTSGYNN
jgi:hypothetical protein